MKEKLLHFGTAKAAGLRTIIEILAKDMLRAAGKVVKCRMCSILHIQEGKNNTCSVVCLDGWGGVYADDIYPLFVPPPPGSMAGECGNVCVKEESRGQGIGTKMRVGEAGLCAGAAHNKPTQKRCPQVL